MRGGFVWWVLLLLRLYKVLWNCGTYTRQQCHTSEHLFKLFYLKKYGFRDLFKTWLCCYIFVFAKVRIEINRYQLQCMLRFTSRERVVTYMLSGTVLNLEKKSFTLCRVFWLNWYLRYLHNKYKLNSDKTWVILPHFTIFLDYYFTCIFDAGSRSSPSPSSRKEKRNWSE